MPVLHKRKDGGYYIKAFVHATHQVGTWQVKPEGVDYLSRFGVTDGETLGAALFRDLIELGLASTGGRGFADQEPKPGDQAPDGRSKRQVTLAVTAEKHTWQLWLLLPEIDPSLFDALDPHLSTDQLLSCSLTVEGGSNTIPATRLWPGSGGTLCPVDPKSGTYLVEPIGAWPSEWGYAQQAKVRGLDPEGVLFARNENVWTRLERGQPVTPGATYYLVRAVSSATAVRGRKPKLGELAISSIVDSLGRSGEWCAWWIRLPDPVDAATANWCASLGHPIEEPTWKLGLASPPPVSYLDGGVPAIEAGRAVLIAAYPPATSRGLYSPVEVLLERLGTEEPLSRLRLAVSRPRRRSSPASSGSQPSPRNGRRSIVRFATLVPELPGKYRLSAVTGRVSPLTFAVVPSGSLPSEIPSQPQALRVSLVTGSSILRLHALQDGPGPHTVRLVPSEEEPSLEFDCPAPLDVRWARGGNQGQLRSTTADAATESIATQLPLATEDRRPLWLEVDGGAYGRLRLRFVWTQADQPRTVTRPMPLATLRRARWLLGITRAQCCSATPSSVVMLPQWIRSVLATHSDELGVPSLPAPVTVPSVLLPHFALLAKSLRCCGDGEDLASARC